MSFKSRSVRILILLTLIVAAGCVGLTSFPGTVVVSTQERLGLLDSLPSPPFEQPVTIYWNEHQIPFIDAKTDRDAALAMGLVHAHLRLGQMEMGKRIATGRLSEMAGPFTTDIDAALRALGFGRSAQPIVDRMPPEGRQWLEAYVEGINFYKSHVRVLPREMGLLGMNNEPWTMEDSVQLGRLGAADINWTALLKLLPFRGKKDWPQIWQRFAATQKEKVTSFASLSSPEHVTKLASHPQADLFSSLLEPFARTGSNSMAVSASRSRSGGALLANDPHLGFTLPNLWVLAGVKSPSYHAVGLMPVGIPVIALGRNPEIAWGGTNMRQWSSDLVEVTGLEGMTTETHTIKRRFLWDKTVTNRLSPYGPVISDTSLFSFPEGRDFAIRWMGHQISDDITSMLRVMRAKGWQDIKASLRDYAMPGQNLIFADRDGAIGHILGAWVPARKTDFPKDIWMMPEESDRAWQRILTVEDLPFIINPPDGVIASSNNRPARTPPTRLGWTFPREDRILRIYERLAGQEKWSLAELKRLQRDAYSLSNHRLSRAMVALVKGQKLPTGAGPVVRHLSSWDGHYSVDSKGAYLHQAVVAEFAPKFYETMDRSGEDQLWWATTYLPEQLQKDMSEADPTLVRRLLLRALQKASPLARDGKTWGDIHRVNVEHLLGRVPYLGRSFRLYDLPIPGSVETVFKSVGTMTVEKHPSSFGSQSRHLSDMSDPNANYFVLFGGQDGAFHSTNFSDQVSLWARGDLIQFPLEVEKVKELFRRQTRFSP